MNDFKQLFATPALRRYWLCLALYQLGSWSVLAALPILVAVRFGVGAELVLSIGIKMLPRILLAPFAGALLYGVIHTTAYDLSPNTWQMSLGLALLAIIVFLPQGLWSLVSRMSRRRAWR